ncbi:MAG: hypothetical protein KGZ39_06540 [Simkania sp.]|nr:hypothetical protein [Simkania sp.]
MMIFPILKQNILSKPAKNLLNFHHFFIEKIGLLQGRLNSLSVYDCTLRSIPEEIGLLEGLETLEITCNRLVRLPRALAQLPNRTSIYAFQNYFTLEAIEEFQEGIQRQQALNPALGPLFEFSIYDARMENPSVSLQEEIAFWLTQFNVEFPLGHTCRSAVPEELLSVEDLERQSLYQPLFSPSEEAENTLSVRERSNLMHFLRRLQEIKDYNEPKTRLQTILRVVQMLHGIVTNGDFRNKVLFIIDDALSTCGDRTAICWNTVELYWNLYCRLEEKEEMSEEETRQLLSHVETVLIGAKRIELLEKHAEIVIKRKRLGDEIESKLYYQVRLREALGLPISAEAMLYPDTSGISEEDLHLARETVLSQTESLEQIIDILAPPDSHELSKFLETGIETISVIIPKLWGEKIKKRCAENFDAIHESINECINKILDDIENINANGDLSSEVKAEEVLVLQEKIGALGVQREREEKALIRRKTEEWIRQRHQRPEERRTFSF